MYERRRLPATLLQRARCTLLDCRSGFSLVEVMITMALVATVSALVIPVFNDYQEEGRIAQAATEIGGMSLDIQQYKERNGRYPTSLAEAGLGDRVDPWGNAYRYFKIEGAKSMGAARKDRFLKPLNSDYDLYSVGADGDSRAPLNNPKSQDDVVRANDGGFIGPARDY